MPLLLKLHLRPDFVEHLHPRREAGLDGMLREDSLREGVQRADGRAVELL